MLKLKCPYCGSLKVQDLGSNVCRCGCCGLMEEKEDFAPVGVQVVAK